MDLTGRATLLALLGAAVMIGLPGGTPPGSTPRWTRHCCSRRWRRGPGTGSTSWPPTAGRATVKGQTGSQLLPALVEAMAPLESASDEESLLPVLAQLTARHRS